MAANKKAGGAATPTGSKFKRKTFAADHAPTWRELQRQHDHAAAVIARRAARFRRSP